MAKGISFSGSKADWEGLEDEEGRGVGVIHIFQDFLFLPENSNRETWDE